MTVGATTAVEGFRDIAKPPSLWNPSILLMNLPITLPITHTPIMTMNTHPTMVVNIPYIFMFKVLLVPLDRRESRERWDPREIRDSRVKRVPPAPRDPKVKRETLDREDRPAPLGPRDPRDPKDLRVKREIRDRQDRPAPLGPRDPRDPKE